MKKATQVRDAHPYDPYILAVRFGTRQDFGPSELESAPRDRPSTGRLPSFTAVTRSAGRPLTTGVPKSFEIALLPASSTYRSFRRLTADVRIDSARQ
jgi:hypothetical protein